MERPGKGKRGFASMDPERRRELARRGGQTVHRLGKAHTFTSEEARLASQKGTERQGRNGKACCKLPGNLPRSSGPHEELLSFSRQGWL